MQPKDSIRLKITLSYDGSYFHGFQLQKDENTAFLSVAGAINKTLEILNIFTTVVGSGRTDSGVHAIAQVIHIDIPSYWSDLARLKKHLNNALSPHIFIRKIEIADKEFHARFNAKKRLYRYFLYDGSYMPFYANYAHHTDPLDAKTLNKLAKNFIGTHNFEYFKKVGGGATKDERTIFKAGAYRHKGFVVVYFSGDAFLRSQVRMMCDMLLKVYHNKLSLDDLLAQLKKERKISNSLAPACGLYLSKVYY